MDARRADAGERRPGPRGAVGSPVPISNADFDAIRDWIHEVAGISLSDQKKALVMGRLAPRLRHYALGDYGAYFQLLRDARHAAELQIAVDLLTTNETHFFREPKHFELLRSRILPDHPRGRMFRAWSAASSSGEEPYSIAMTLAAALGEAPWEVLASDLSMRMLERARSAHYSMARAKTIPRTYLLEYCLKGVGAQDGTFLIESRVRNRVSFAQINLAGALPPIGEFDLVFLRNVMIYFDIATKREVVTRMLSHLRRGGHMIVGHSESLNGVCDALKAVAPSVYRKP